MSPAQLYAESLTKARGNLRVEVICSDGTTFISYPDTIRKDLKKAGIEGETCPYTAIHRAIMHEKSN